MDTTIVARWQVFRVSRWRFSKRRDRLGRVKTLDKREAMRAELAKRFSEPHPALRF